jgi:hypothetical protein
MKKDKKQWPGPGKYSNANARLHGAIDIIVLWEGPTVAILFLE